MLDDLLRKYIDSAVKIEEFGDFDVRNGDTPWEIMLRFRFWCIFCCTFFRYHCIYLKTLRFIQDYWILLQLLKIILGYLWKSQSLL